MKSVLFSFDLEEFDTPLEYGYNIPFSEQVEISKRGTEIVLDILNKFDVKATFFSTVQFAESVPEVIRKLCINKHELASHGYYHSRFEERDLLLSKVRLEELFGMNVVGFRMPRMKAVNYAAIKSAGYQYDSSINPVFIPGRYNNYFRKRTIYKEGELWELPASATPMIRVPLFWLSFHNLPLSFYKLICQMTLNTDGYAIIYFHPWEFTDLRNKFNLPRIVQRNTGEKMITRFMALLDWMKKKGYRFTTIKEHLTDCINRSH